MEKQSKSHIPMVRENGDAHYSILQNMEYYFQEKLYKKLNHKFYKNYSLIGEDDPDRIKFKEIFHKMEKDKNFNPEQLGLNLTESRGIGSFLGMAICDALGSCTEFLDYKKEGHKKKKKENEMLIKDSFADIYQSIKEGEISSRHGEITTWTDDASMGIAMACSLLAKNYEFYPIHIRYMFNLWLCHGLGNGGREYSIGLGGNISISMDEFIRKQSEFASEGNNVKNFNNGNGSLMRLATIPIAFHKNKELAMKYSAESSRTTHNGFEAEECCRLLAAIIVEMINRKEQKIGDKEKMEIEEPFETTKKEEEKDEKQNWKIIFENVCESFKSKEKSVECLAKSQQETEELYQENKERYKPFKEYNKSIDDRNWNWKNKDFTYSKHRNKQMPGYIGSYCMDGFAMALHTVWHTKSFKECALMNANMGGDCDTVGSIAGQMAGAIYGVTEEMLRLYSEMKDFKEKRFEAFLLGYKLVNEKNQTVAKEMHAKQEDNNGKKRESDEERDKEEREMGNIETEKEEKCNEIKKY